MGCYKNNIFLRTTDRTEKDFPLYSKSEKQFPVSLTNITRGKNEISIIPAIPFCYSSDFLLEVTVDNEKLHFSKKDVSEVIVKDLEKFQEKSQNNVLYRLYTPRHSAMRPLILFLHGSGESGYDNLMQMTGTLGALKLATAPICPTMVTNGLSGTVISKK